MKIFLEIKFFEIFSLTVDFINAKQAVQIIENAWCRHRDRQMFRLLKHAVCAAEHALSNDILRRLSPREAELLRDPSLNVKVKFR